MFPTISNQILGNTFTLSLNTSNIPTGSKLTLTTTFGNIYPSSITTTGTLTSTNVYITSASGNISISASVNGSVVGTSNTFSVSSPTSCLQEYSLQGLCVPSSPSTPDPKSLSPGTYTSPGPELSSISQTFSWSPVSGASKYAFYLRDLDSDTLVISNENLTSPTYTYNYLGSGKRYRWNTVAFTSTSNTGWYADPVYFTVKAGLTQPTRTIASLTQDELSLCDGSFSCEGMTFQVIAIDSPNGLQAISTSTEYFLEGMEDEIFIQTAGVAIGTIVAVGLKPLAPTIATIASKIALKTGITAVGAKGVVGLTGVGVALLIVGTAAIVAFDTKELTTNCLFVPKGTISVDSLLGISRPSEYYCGRLAIRAPVGALTLAVVSKVGTEKALAYSALKNANAGSISLLTKSGIKTDVKLVDINVWLYDKFIRGTLIEDLVGGNNLGRFFPVLDQYWAAARAVVSVKSMDTSLISYQTRSGMYSTLKGYGDKLLGFTGKGDIIRPSMYDTKQLHLVIPENVRLNAEQEQALLDFAAYLRTATEPNGKTVELIVTFLGVK